MVYSCMKLGNNFTRVLSKAREIIGIWTENARKIISEFHSTDVLCV